MAWHHAHTFTETELLDVAALADGSIAPARRAEVLARVAASPMLTEALTRQRQAVAAIRAAALPAPARLRARVEGCHRSTEAARFAIPVRARGAIPVRARGALGTAAAVAAVVFAVLVLTRGSAAGPTVTEVAAVAARKPVQAAPTVVKSDPGVLRRVVAGVAFPNLETKFGWRAVGARDDTIGGQRATTVFYAKDGRRIAYTIVAGRSLDWPVKGHRMVRNGAPFESFRPGGVPAVTWRERGKTCVISGKGTAPAELMRLASA